MCPTIITDVGVHGCPNFFPFSFYMSWTSSLEEGISHAWEVSSYVFPYSCFSFFFSPSSCYKQEYPGWNECGLFCRERRRSIMRMSFKVLKERMKRAIHTYTCSFLLLAAYTESHGAISHARLKRIRHHTSSLVLCFWNFALDYIRSCSAMPLSSQSLDPLVSFFFSASRVFPLICNRKLLSQFRFADRYAIDLS